jgi:predicted transcriptional regulator
MKIRKIRLEKKGPEALLSPLEADVLRILWERESIKVRDLHSVLKKKREVALTSVAVTLDRLHKKKLVERKAEPGRGGYHYIYSSCASESDFEHSILDTTVDKLIDMFGSTAVNYFNERFSKNEERK